MVATDEAIELLEATELPIDDELRDVDTDELLATRLDELNEFELLLNELLELDTDKDDELDALLVATELLTLLLTEEDTKLETDEFWRDDCEDIDDRLD